MVPLSVRKLFTGIMRKIKILYGLESAADGALKHLVYLVTRLDRAKFDISVLISNLRSCEIEGEIEKMQMAGAKVSIFPMRQNISLLHDSLAVIKLFRIIRTNEFDIVHAHSSKAGGLFRIAAWMNKTPKIFYTPHCFYFQGKAGYGKVFFVTLEKILGKFTTGIIVSENERNEAICNRICPESKLFSINNAIDFNEYKHLAETEKYRKELNIPEEHFVIGSIGRLVPQKDWVTLIFAAREILKINKKAVFLIAGDGELKNYLKRLISDLNLENNVLTLGYVKDIYKMYEVIDVLVNSSLWEGLPYTFLEAMAYKKPIIATNTGNQMAVLDKATGFISPKRDHLTLADKINQLIRNKALAINMGKRGNEWFTQKYSFEYFIQRHEEVYGEGRRETGKVKM